MSTTCNSGDGDRVDADEIAVYLAIASSDHSKAIVVSSDAIRALGILEAEHVRSLLPSAPEAAIRDFLDKNQKDLILTDDVTVDGGF
ncbi:MAG TPA: hypothetical protein VK918_09320, partial [Pyrinomonadaceae bacterium]|nr:hypothetical protein [Pyrinomonadaceae bacterium]